MTPAAQDKKGVAGGTTWPRTLRSHLPEPVSETLFENREFGNELESRQSCTRVGGPKSNAPCPCKDTDAQRRTEAEIYRPEAKFCRPRATEERRHHKTLGTGLEWVPPHAPRPWRLASGAMREHSRLFAVPSGRRSGPAALRAEGIGAKRGGASHPTGSTGPRSRHSEELALAPHSQLLTDTSSMYWAPALCTAQQSGGLAMTRTNQTISALLELTSREMT